MRVFRRSLVVAAAVALSACATNSTMRPPEPAPHPTVVLPPATGHGAPNAHRCMAGNGQVVRLTNPDSGGAAMNGGVLGGVLGDGAADQNAHPAAGNASGHDIYVQMDDGRKLIVSQRELGGIAMGSRVSVDENCRARLAR